MYRLVIFALIAMAALLPLIFRRSLIVRIGGIAVLCFVAGIPYAHLTAAHRSVMEAGYNTLKVTPGDLPPDFMLAVKEIQAQNHAMLSLYQWLIAALILLAVFPLKRSAKPGSD